MCAFIIDLDSFKKYNDAYGHQEGDKVIKLQADMLSKTFRRTTDIVARYGGEEFVVVTSNNTEQECNDLAKRIIEDWENQKVPHCKSEGKGYVICSVGFHFEVISNNSNKDIIVDKADQALYQAKAAGKSCFVQYKDIEGNENIKWED